MGKNRDQPLFRITISTLTGVEMSFLVKRGYRWTHLSKDLWDQLLKQNIVSKDSSVSYDVACDGRRVDWGKKLKDYNVRDDVDHLPHLTLVLRRPGF